MWDAHDGMGWWMVFGMIWMVVFWGAVIWAIVWAATRMGEGRRERGESALDIAR